MSLSNAKTVCFAMPVMRKIEFPATNAATTRIRFSALRRFMIPLLYVTDHVSVEAIPHLTFVTAHV